MGGDDPIMQFFRFSHLPPHLAAVAEPFGDLATKVNDSLPNNPERAAALRSLLVAKDAAVRALLFQSVP